MRNILVTGSNGQLGSEIRKLVQNSIGQIEYKNDNFFFTSRYNLDVTNGDEINKFIEVNNINIIINCAAYTAVDKAESDEITANNINNLAVKNLAQTSKVKNIQLIHVSTDYVFDGKNFRPYLEDDITNPNGVYGRTKLDGEKIMLNINPLNSIIIRTSWLYSSFGVNFVKTMLRFGKDKDEVGVVFDQVGTPTYARDLARTILEILPSLKSEKVEIYNYSNEGVLSWYDFAKEIMHMTTLECKVNPIESQEYPTPCVRPHYSLLNKRKIKQTFNIEIPYWKDSLVECLKEMGEIK